MLVNKDHPQEGDNEPLTAEGSLDREVSMSKFEKVAQEQDNVLLFSLHDCLSR